MATTSTSCAAKNLTLAARKVIALQAITNNKKITEIAEVNQVSRNFVYSLKDQALQGIDEAFQVANDNDVLFYLPVTKKWLIAFILCLILHCKACYRGIYKLLTDSFDYNISIGTIHNIAQTAAVTAKNINKEEDLKTVTLAAPDELFYNDKPILTGVDIPTLYCYLLSKEKNRDADTWAINLLDLQKQKFNPLRIIADDADGLRAGHDMVYWNIPCDADNFHITKDLIEMRRYFRNKLKSAITYKIGRASKLQKAIMPDAIKKYTDQLTLAIKEEKLMLHLTNNIDILVSWMEHDVLNKPGPNIIIRRELFNFIVQELESLAKLYPHRILPICVKLKNQRDLLLAFVDVLEDKFITIAEQYQCSIDTIWEICKLQRCKYFGDNYIIRSEPIILQLGNVFEEIEDAVIAALDSTERTSSMVENLNSRISPYLFMRKTSNQSFLDLLRFYLNHTQFLRSEREYRVNKTPAELLNGPHKHWLKMLGYSRFKRIA